MSEDAESKSDLPLPGDHKTTATNYRIGFRFHPEIKLDRKRGYELSTLLADYVAIERTEFESHKWTLCEPLAGRAESALTITVEKSRMSVEVEFPKQGQEWVENRIRSVLRVFSELIRPKMILLSEASVCMTLPIDGDARSFLSNHVMRINMRHADKLERPVHVIGIKLSLPPYKADKKVDWHVTLRAESLFEDPSRLFLQGDAAWLEPMRWEDDSFEAIIGHLQQLRTYMEDRFLSFLMSLPGSSEDSDDDLPAEED